MNGQHQSATATGKRGHPRARIGLPAMLETLKWKRSVTLQNISETGALIQVDNPPAPGSDVIVQCGRIDLMARVMWTERACCGIQFDENAPMQDILDLKAESDRIARTGYSYAQLKAGEDWKSGQVR